MPYDPVTGEGGGLLGGGFSSNPLLQFGIGLLSQPKYSLTPQGPFEGVGKALAYSTASQDAQLKNQYLREKILQARTKTAQEAQIAKLLFGDGGAASATGAAPAPASGGGDTGIAGASAGAAADSSAPAAAPTANPILGGNDPRLVEAAFAVDPSATLTKLVQPPMNALDAQKFKENETQIRLEGAAANENIHTTQEASELINRLGDPNSPIQLGSSAAKKLWNDSQNDDGTLKSVSAEDFAKFVNALPGGKKYSQAQLNQFLSDWNRLTKLASKSIQEDRALEAQYSTAGGTGNRLTNMGLGYIASSNINPGVDATANIAILRDRLRKQLAAADIRGWNLPLRGAANDLMRSWDAQLDPSKATPYNVPPPAGAVMPAPSIPERAAGIAGAVLNRGADILEGGLGINQPPSAPPAAPINTSGGVQNGWFAPAPSPAAAAPAPNAPSPDATRVRTTPISPNVKLNAQGVPTFNRFADLQRAEKNGWLKGFTSVMVNGKIFDWVQ